MHGHWGVTEASAAELVSSAERKPVETLIGTTPGTALSASTQTAQSQQLFKKKAIGQIPD